MADEVIPTGSAGSNSFESPNGTVLFPRYESNDTIVSRSFSSIRIYSLISSFQYEITPLEYGSWQGRASAFANTKFAGTSLNGGVPVNTNVCVEGFDSAAFTLGSVVTAINLCEHLVTSESRS